MSHALKVVNAARYSLWLALDGMATVALFQNGKRRSRAARLFMHVGYSLSLLFLFVVQINRCW